MHCGFNNTGKTKLYINNDTKVGNERNGREYSQVLKAHISGVTSLRGGL